MWTHSGYQLSQIARVKPTHSLTSVPLPYSVRSLNPIFLVSKLLSYRFFLLSVVPLSRTPVTGRTLSRRLFLRLNSTILSLTLSLFSSLASLQLPFSTVTHSNHRRLFFVVGRPASFPGTSFLLTSDCFCPRPAAPWPNRFAVSLNFPDHPYSC